MKKFREVFGKESQLLYTLNALLAELKVKALFIGAREDRLVPLSSALAANWASLIKAKRKALSSSPEASLVGAHSSVARSFKTYSEVYSFLQRL